MPHSIVIFTAAEKEQADLNRFIDSAKVGGYMTIDGCVVSRTN